MDKNNWLDQIEREFNNQTRADIIELINQCRKYCKDDEMTDSICDTIVTKRNITFKQWKALRAELSKRRNPNKTI
jgi:hypothetical protein